MRIRKISGNIAGAFACDARTGFLCASKAVDLNPCATTRDDDCYASLYTHLRKPMFSFKQTLLLQFYSVRAGNIIFYDTK